MGDDRRRRRDRRGQRLYEEALRPGSDDGARAAAMSEAVASGAVDPWYARAAATLGDEGAFRAGFEPWRHVGDDGLEWTPSDAEVAAAEGWELCLRRGPGTTLGIHVLDSASRDDWFSQRWQAEEVLRARAAHGDRLAVKAFALFAIVDFEGRKHHGSEFWFCMVPFNPEFSGFLAAEGHLALDWPADIASGESLRLSRAFGIEDASGGDFGWRTSADARSAADAELRRVVDGFMIRAVIGCAP